ncbi:MAG: cobyrinate a,c-diamide synthase [Anaerolineae bacterium]
MAAIPTGSPSPREPGRLVIAAPRGRSGKTTVAVGLAAALRARGLAVQPFKKGPDFIDPSWLTEAAGRPCRNLDPYLMGQEGVQEVLARGSRGADVCLVEGAMGLYDGLDDEGSGSTAVLARWLRAPVVLVVDAARITRSAAALVLGYAQFEPETWLAGVIFNGVQGARHEAKLRSAIGRYCSLPVWGALPRAEALTIPDRHLGLVPRAEGESWVAAVEAAREAVEQTCDVPGLLDLARSAPPLGWQAPLPPRPSEGNRVRVGVVRDRAFTFYYPENLEALEAAGAELIFVDACSDPSLPAVDALYLGGGFPEVFLEELEANRALRQDVRAAAQEGLPIYAECGGLMYLCRRLVWGERMGKMAGILPATAIVEGRPAGHGYVAGEVARGNPFYPVGLAFRGHEFHHSRVDLEEDLPRAFRLHRGQGLGNGQDGLVWRNVLATYTHVHAVGTPQWARGLVEAARRFRQGEAVSQEE